MKRKYLSVLAVGLLAFGLPSLANATAINYIATDLPDVNQGQDLWQYSYWVSDHTFTADTGFTVYFDLGLYDLLDPNPIAPNADWNVMTWNPDPSLPDDGAYDALALVDNASLANPFTVSFVWLGGGIGPGSQSFEVYGYDPSTGNINILETGNAAPVPEPATILLFGIGSAGLVCRGMKKKRSSHNHGYPSA